MTEGSDYIRDQTKFKSHRDIIMCAERVTQTHSHHHRRQVRREKADFIQGSVVLSAFSAREAEMLDHC